MALKENNTKANTKYEPAATCTAVGASVTGRAQTGPGTANAHNCRSHQGEKLNLYLNHPITTP